MADESITRFETAGGARVYRLPLQVFPHLWAYAHLVIDGDYLALIDVGSGQGESDAHLRAGFERVASDWGEHIGWADLDRIIITHAHIDHHGGLNMLRGLSAAPIAVHELDRRVIVHHEERLILSQFRLGVFLSRAGVDPERRARLLKMYSLSKHLFRSVDVQDVLRDGDCLDERFQIIHVPGHCPGQVCLQFDDLLFTADHVLPEVSVFLAPESLNASIGVDHFLQSLRRVKGLDGVRLGLGGHDQPVYDLGAAVEKIEAIQATRIARVYEACAEPHSIAELSTALYPSVSGYDEILALEKVGAYIEYLDQRGMLEVANLDDVAADEANVPRYRAA